MKIRTNKEIGLLLWNGEPAKQLGCMVEGVWGHGEGGSNLV